MANKFNPFRPDKMAGPGLFCGRWEELVAIDHCLLQTKKGNPQHFIVQGERGVGKSSLFLCSQYVATSRVTTMEGDEKLDFITLSVTLQEEDDYIFNHQTHHK